MNSRLLQALALASALGSTIFIAVQADAQQGNAPRVEDRAGPSPARMGRMSAEDRAAFFDARLAAIKAGLKLTPDQEKLWPPVEDAARGAAKKMTALAEQGRLQPRAVDPLERLQRMADASTTRGEALRALVDAAKPLYATLTDDQKRRLPLLMHGPEGPRAAMMDRLRGWWNGDGREGPRRQGFMSPRDGDGWRHGPGARDDSPL